MTADASVPTTGAHASLVGLGARVHLFIRPGRAEAFTVLFRDVLRCTVLERDFGLEHPVLLVRFDDGSSFSVEVTDLAPAADDGLRIDDGRAFRGAWIEFRARDVDVLLARLRAAGVPEFRHPGSGHAYFAAPGGQVFRLLDVGYAGP